MKLNDIVAFRTCEYLQCDSIMVANISLADFFMHQKIIYTRLRKTRLSKKVLIYLCNTQKNTTFAPVFLT